MANFTEFALAEGIIAQEDVTASGLLESAITLLSRARVITIRNKAAAAALELTFDAGASVGKKVAAGADLDLRVAGGLCPNVYLNVAAGESAAVLQWA